LARRFIYPKAANRPIPSEVPREFAEDYAEASVVLSESPKASAALSRRCLQNLLRNVAEASPSTLFDEIQEVLDSADLPSHIADSLDAVRNIGNFAAHPSKSKSSGEIVPVEPHEAEWNLDTLEALFDYYFVAPAKQAAKKVALNAKLADVGKPPMNEANRESTEET